MKLYSRNQVFFYSVASVLVVVLLLVGFGVLSFSGNSGSGKSGKMSEDILRQDLPVEDVLVTSNLDPNTGLFINNKGEYSSDELNNIRVYEALNEAVVNVTTEVVGYNWFLEPIPQEGSSGSGSIIDKRGFVLTNNHVVDKAYKVYITLADGSQYEGEVIGTDYENDLSVLNLNRATGILSRFPSGLQITSRSVRK